MHCKNAPAFCAGALTLGFLGVLLAPGPPAVADTPDQGYAVMSGQYMYVVKPPAGWVGDMKNASEYQCDILIYPQSGKVTQDTPIVTIALWPKEQSVSVATELHNDMARWSKRYPNTSFQDFAVARKGFQSYAKIYFVPGVYTDYVAYLDPGAQLPYYFIVSLQPGHRPKADDFELGALTAIVKSLTPLATIE